MKILLTVPFYPYRYSHPPLPDLGLGYLASSLRNAGHNVYVNDWNNRDSLEQSKNILQSIRPDIVGLKFFTLNTLAAQKTVHFLRSVLGKKVIIVMGGPHPSVEEKKWLLHDFSDVDGRFVGEAEESFAGVLDQLNNQGNQHKAIKRISNVPGFETFTDEETEQTRLTIIENLDTLSPPAWDLIRPKTYPAFDIDGKKRILAPFMATRGCPLGCKFCCTENISGKQIRHHSVDYVLDQITYLHKNHNVSAITFLDTNFMTDINWLQLMVDRLAPSGNDIVWNCVWGLNSQKIDKQILQGMYSSGCRAIIMGIESGNDIIRQQTGKKETACQIREQVRMIKESGIEAHGFFMLGFPEETLSQMHDTIRFAFSLPLDVFSYSIVYPLPNTTFYEWLKKKYSIPRIEWTNFNIYRSPYPMSKLSSRTLSFVRRYVQFRNMINPRKLFAEYKRGNFSGEIIKAKIKQLLNKEVDHGSSGHQ